MRSHRLVHTGKGRFWEVHWEGSEVETTSGVLGTNGRSTEKSLSSSRQADEWVAERLTKKRNEGFVELTEVGTKSAPLVVDELLERIRAAPDDDALRHVYADQLTAAGDPLGEFIAVQLSLASAPDGPSAAVHRHRERELLERFRTPWSGNLRGVELRFERGFAVEARLRLDDLAPYAPTLWKTAPLLTRLHATNESSWHAAEVLQLLGAVPEATRLRELHVTFLAGGSQAVATALIHAPNLAGLEALSLRRAGLADLDVFGLLEEGRFPKLRRVDLRNNTLAARALRALRKRPFTQLLLANNRIGQSSVSELSSEGALGGLERLDLSGNAIGDEGLRVLGAARFTAMKRLGLSHVNATWDGLTALARGPIAQRLVHLELAGNEVRREGLRTIFGGAFPALTHLDVSEAMLGDEGVQALLDAPAASQLVSLELKRNAISVEGAARLASADFPHLEYLSVSGNPLGEQGLSALKKAFPRAQVVGRGAGTEGAD